MFFTRVLALAMPALLAAAAPTLVTEPDQGLTPIYNLITSARTSLDLTMYEFTDTAAAQLMAQAVAGGVTVRVILDQNNERRKNQAVYDYLADNGCQVHWANPAFACTHQKTLTVDGSTAAIMTLNFSSQYYATSRDYAVVVEDPADVAAIGQVFDTDFTDAAITPPLGDNLIWSPTNAQSSLLALIGGARQTLQVECEEMSDPSIVAALGAAAGRGLPVTVVMTFNARYTPELDRLKAAGVRIATYPESAPLYIHAKVVLADAAIPAAVAFVGSENFSKASLTRNRELGLTTRDPAVLAALQGTIGSDFSGGDPY